ncbi:DUF3367 domain-containing protein, partial [Micromonospora globispora]|uniref:discoidin domain-containing protein n=1 Tax=Micromonospora globispora TaxID=1450148 RepID=UPI000D85FCEF
VAARPGAVADGDPATTWYAADSDRQPWVRLTWPKARTITGLRMTLPPTAAAARPWQVTVIGDGGMRGGVLDEGGTLVFDRPLSSNEITVLISDIVPARSYDPYRRLTQNLPVGIGELTVLSDPPVLRNPPDQRVTLPCGSGPTVEVGGVRRRTALVASRRELVELREVDAQLCGAEAKAPLALAGGEVRVVAVASRLAAPTQLVLTPGAVQPDRSGGSAAGSGAAIQTPVRVDGWSATERRLHLDAYPNQRVLAMRENANAGWVATAAGRTLTPFVVDGWQQGWLVPAGLAGEVVLRFAPDNGYVLALSAGVLLLAGVAVVATLPSRRTPGRVPVVARARRGRRVLVGLFGGAAEQADQHSST